MNQPTKTPPPPYYAVIFTTRRTTDDVDGYAAMAERMDELAKTMPGYLGIDSVRDADGFGITVSYWENESNIRHWRQQAEHLEAQAQGKAKWYDCFELRVCKVERAYGFQRG